MTFDLYISQTPQSPDCRTSKKCSGDIGVSEKNSVDNSPWGEENPSWLIAYLFYAPSVETHCVINAFYRPTTLKSTFNGYYFIADNMDLSLFV